MANTKKPSTIKASAKMPAEPAQPIPTSNIANWRLFRGITSQRILANMVKEKFPAAKGLDRVSICRLESGTARWNEDHIAILSSVLECQPGDLISTNPFEAGDIFALYAGLSATDKRRALKLLQQLKS